MKLRTAFLLPMVLSLVLGGFAKGEISVAVLNFDSKESSGDLAEDFGTLFEFSLGMQDGILLVARDQLDEALDELALGASGTVSPDYAGKIGQLTGAQVLVSGRLLSIGDGWVVVSKIMGTETMRLFSAKVSFSNEGEIGDAVEALGSDVAAQIRKHSQDLLATSDGEEDNLDQVIERAEGRILPKVRVVIPEEHIGRRVPDPAAQTEIIRILREVGFTVLDVGSKEDADFSVTGEAFSEAGMRIRDLISCRARVEVKAVDASSGTIVFSDAKSATAVDTTEFISGKTALQKAGGKISPALARALIGSERESNW